MNGFDTATEQVEQSLSLGYSRHGEFREIKEAEGVAIDTTTDRLYVVQVNREGETVVRSQLRQRLRSTSVRVPGALGWACFGIGR